MSRHAWVMNRTEDAARVRVPCRAEVCTGPFRMVLLSEAWIDLNGEPFRAYWHPGCAVALMKSEHPHREDAACIVSIESGCCIVCDAVHSDPCPTCEASGYHEPECPENDHDLGCGRVDKSTASCCPDGCVICCDCSPCCACKARKEATA